MAHHGIGLGLVPDQAHSLLERPRLAPFPLHVRAPQGAAEHQAGACREQVPGLTRSRAGSVAPKEPTSRTPARGPPATRTLPGVRSPWLITSGASRGSSLNAAHIRDRAPDVQEPLAFPEAGAHPLVMVLQVTAAL
jgi:hypothetical protein